MHNVARNADVHCNYPANVACQKAHWPLSWLLPVSSHWQSSQLMFLSDAYIRDSLIYFRRNFQSRHHMICGMNVSKQHSIKSVETHPIAKHCTHFSIMEYLFDKKIDCATAHKSGKLFFWFHLQYCYLRFTHHSVECL